MPRHLINLSLAALVVALTGCDDLDQLSNFDCHGTIQHEATIECDSSGGARVTSPTFALPARMEGAGTCADATCVTFATGDGFRNFRMTITYGNNETGTFSLRGGDGAPVLSGTMTSSDGYTSPLVVRAGTFTLTERDGLHVAGTFDVHVQSEDGQHHIVLTDGAFDVGSNCQAHDHAYCVPGPTGY